MQIIKKILFVLSALFLLAYQGYSVTNSMFKSDNISILRSANGHYVAVSTNRVWNMNLLRWMEGVGGKVGKITGIKVPLSSRTIRIIIPIKPSGNDNISWSQGFHQGKFTQQLTLYDYNKADVHNSEIALCGIFLNGYVVAGQIKIIGHGEDFKPGIVSSWLALGVAKNLYPSYRQQSSIAVIELYENGKLPTVKKLLSDACIINCSWNMQGDLYGMFVLWLSRMPVHADIFAAMFDRLAKKEKITPQVIAEIIPDCDSVGALESKWINWILEQKNTVYMPGFVTPQVLQKLKSALVITPEECMRVNGAEVNDNIQFSDLISVRKDSWVPVCMQQKIINLKLQFVGYGGEVNDVVDKYCNFLQAVETHKSKRYQLKLLGIADEAYKTLQNKYQQK